MAPNAIASSTGGLLRDATVDLVARGDEVARHGQAHGSEADEPELHEDLRLLSASTLCQCATDRQVNCVSVDLVSGRTVIS